MVLFHLAHAQPSFQSGPTCLRLAPPTVDRVLLNQSIIMTTSHRYATGQPDLGNAFTEAPSSQGTPGCGFLLMIATRHCHYHHHITTAIISAKQNYYTTQQQCHSCAYTQNVCKAYYRDACTAMLIEVVFAMAGKQDQANCPPAGEWL